MTGHGQKFGRKREQAIAALLVQPTITEAARVLGIGEKTLRLWLKDRAFRDEYRETRRQVVEHATALLQTLGSSAVRALKEIVEDPKAPPSARVMACRTVLEMGQKGVELEELIDRIESLEANRPIADRATPIRGAR